MPDGEEDICGHPLASKDGHCDRSPSYPDGKCGFHTKAKDDDRDWKPNYKHGLYQDRGEYYQNLPEADKEWLDAVSDDLLEKSKFGKDDLSALEKCRQISISLHQVRRADGYISKKGLTQKNTVGFHEDFGEIEQVEENTLMIAKDRLSRETRMTMKDLGILDDEDGAGEDDESFVEKLSKNMSDS